jgi:hypothetical protein
MAHYIMAIVSKEGYRAIAEDLLLNLLLSNSTWQGLFIRSIALVF